MKTRAFLAAGLAEFFIYPLFTGLALPQRFVYPYIPFLGVLGVAAISQFIPKKFKAVAAMLLLIGTVAGYSFLVTSSDDFPELKEAGYALKRYADQNSIVLDRKPYTAFFAGVMPKNFLMIPFRDMDGVIEYAHQTNANFLVMSRRVISTFRPQLMPMFNPDVRQKYSKSLQLLIDLYPDSSVEVLIFRIFPTFNEVWVTNKLSGNIIAAYRCSGVNDSKEINKGIDLAAIHHGIVHLTENGSFTVSSPIIVKSNITLMGRNTLIYLADSSNCSIVRNANAFSGYGIHLIKGKRDHDIRISGITFKGNGINQILNFKSQPQYGGYWGWGLLFRNVDALNINNCVVDSCSTFAVATVTCNHVIISNIKCHQYGVFAIIPGQTRNHTGGFVGYGCNNVLLDSITGWSGEDFITCQSERDTMDLYTAPFPVGYLMWRGGDSDSLTFKNIRMDSFGFNWVCIDLCPIQGSIIKDILIDNLDGVAGGYQACGVEVSQYLGSEMSFIKNLLISNVSLLCTNPKVPLVAFDDKCSLTNVRITDCKKWEFNCYQLSSKTFQNEKGKK